MKRSAIATVNKNWFLNEMPYKLWHHSEFNFSYLKNIMTITRAGKGAHITFADCFIMLDTETSKSIYREDNHICAWTISIRAYDLNICTIYGHHPHTMIETVLKIHSSIGAERTIIYVHNLGYDWVFIRKFMFKKYGDPIKQLNTKPYYPIMIEFENGIQLRDSYILSQRSLEKWANDLDVEHKKAKGSWDYDLYRNQSHVFTDDELHYIENDTLAGVECLDSLKKTLKKHIYSMPYTATGIPRNEVRKRGQKNHAHERFMKQALTWQQQETIQTWLYHGGYTHGNRHTLNWVIREKIKAFDFASSYPFILCAFKFSSGQFSKIDDKSPAFILRYAEDNAFYFKFIAYKIQLVNDGIPMPALQYSKCISTVNPILDNGRILQADYVEIYLTEIDLQIIAEQYKVQRSICVDVHVSGKDYLPRWFTDYVYELFEEKTRLKGGDPVLYSIAKSKLNSLYGMCCQRPVRPTIKEDYKNGEYFIDEEASEEDYNKYVERYSSVLNYQIGVWVTAYAMQNLFKLGKCAGTWLYSDTDSCYGYDWNEAKIKRYNEDCKIKLLANNYGAVNHNGREYWLGIAELDGIYNEFVCVGAKRYAVRKEDGSIKITVAGVPKSGVKCLDNDLNNFRKGMIFSGTVTGKKTHKHIIVDDIYIDEEGNEVGDSIDLIPCDYLLNDTPINSIDDLFVDEVEMRIFEE